MLPYFRNKIPGFSVEENVPESILWDINNGPWEWKGSVIRNMNVAYGKFFNKKAGYISLEYLPDFINYRRFVSKLYTDDIEVYKEIVKHESLSTKELKAILGYSNKRSVHRSPNPFKNMPELTATHKENSKTESRMESALTRLLMSGHIVIADFEYNYDRQGNQYGWGIARYTTPEALYEIKPAKCSPETSLKELFINLYKEFPDADPNLILKILK